MHVLWNALEEMEVTTNEQISPLILGNEWIHVTMNRWEW